MLVLLLLPKDCSALGISPGGFSMNFQPGLEQKLDFSVLNSYEDLPFDVEVYIDGELSQYIDFEGVNATLPPGGEKKFSTNLKLPDSFDRPGNHTANIIAMQSSVISGDSGGSNLGALVAVKSRILVLVPYDGPYLDALFHSSDRAVGEKVPFSIFVRSLGTAPIPDLRGEITISDFNGDFIDVLTFEDSLEINQEKEIFVWWDSTGQSAGLYVADLTLRYDDEVYEANTDFKLGSLFIDILEFDKSIPAGKINKYPVTVLSTWNDHINNVYVQLLVDYHGDSKVSKSESFSIGPWENKTVLMFVDSTDIEIGEYLSTLSVFYENSHTDVDFNLKVVEDENIIIYIAVGVILILMILFVLFRRKIFKRRGKNG